MIFQFTQEIERMDSKFSFRSRIQRRLYHGDESTSVDSPSLPLTEASVEYFQDSFPGCEGLGRLDMPMAATITKRNQVSPCSMVVSMLYAKRLRQRSKQYLQSMSSTDVFFISMMMASKYMYDEGIDEEVYNDEWAASVGQEVEDVNQMEMDFLNEMDWQLFVKPEEFDRALTAIERRLAVKEGIKRGWFTYTELALVLDWGPMYDVCNQVGLDCTKMVSLLSAVYVASLVSMMGSAAIAVQMSGPLTTATLAMLTLHTSYFVGNTPPSQVPFVSSAPKGIPDMPGIPHISEPSPMMSRLTEGATHLQDNDFDGTDMNGTRSEDDEGRGHYHGMDMTKEVQRCQTLQTSNPLSEKPPDGMTVSGCSDGDEDGKMDPVENVDASRPTAKGKRASVLSLWLFDSLLSQVWSVFGRQSKSDSVGRQDGNPHLPRDSSGQRVNEQCVNEQRVHGKNGNCGNKNIRKSHHANCKRCLSRKSQSQDEPITPSSNLQSSNFAPKDCGLLGDENGPNPGTAGIISHLVHRDDEGNCHYVESCPTTCQQPCPTSNRPPSYEQLTLPLCNNHPVQDSLPNQTSNPTSYPLSPKELDSEQQVYSLYQGFSPHLFPNKENNNLELILPTSLMADVPILDPVGFFTKNTDTFYVLST